MSLQYMASSYVCYNLQTLSYKSSGNEIIHSLYADMPWNGLIKTWGFHSSYNAR